MRPKSRLGNKGSRAASHPEFLLCERELCMSVSAGGELKSVLLLWFSKTISSASRSFVAAGVPCKGGHESTICQNWLCCVKFPYGDIFLESKTAVSEAWVRVGTHGNRPVRLQLCPPWPGSCAGTAPASWGTAVLSTEVACALSTHARPPRRLPCLLITQAPCSTIRQPDTNDPGWLRLSELPQTTSFVAVSATVFAVSKSRT